VALATTACLAAAGCGSGAHSGGAAAPSVGPRNVVLTAYDHTIAAGSARITLRETVMTSGEAAAQGVTVTGSGVVDLSGRMGQFSFAVPQEGAVTMRIIGPELYMELPPQLRNQVPGGKAWVSINLDKVAQAKLGASLSQLSSSSQTLGQTLTYLRSVSDTGLVRVGVATVDGVATTEYGVTVDLTKAAARESAQAQAAVRKLEMQIHRTTLPMQVWIDHQNRVRQVAYHLSVPAPAGGTDQIAVTEGISGFGAPVKISPPPAAEVDDITNQAVTAATSTTS